MQMRANLFVLFDMLFVNYLTMIIIQDFNTPVNPL